MRGRRAFLLAAAAAGVLMLPVIANSETTTLSPAEVCQELIKQNPIVEKCTAHDTAEGDEFHVVLDTQAIGARMEVQPHSVAMLLASIPGTLFLLSGKGGLATSAVIVRWQGAEECTVTARRDFESCKTKGGNGDAEADGVCLMQTIVSPKHGKISCPADMRVP